MTIKFIWNDDYATGIAELDDQHKKIFDLGNSIADIKNTDRIKKSIMSLYKYTRLHFDFEENLMKDAGYPVWKSHREIHEDLITELNTVGKKVAGNELSIDEFKRFVYVWIVDHIMFQDKQFANYYKKKKST